MNAKLLKTSAIVLFLGFAQGANAAVVALTNNLTPTTIPTLTTKGSFKDTISANKSIVDQFDFAVTSNSNVTASITASFSSKAGEIKNFSAELYDLSTNKTVATFKPTYSDLITEKYNGTTFIGATLNAKLFSTTSLVVGDKYAIKIGGDTGSTSALYTGSISVSAVPEPEEWAMMMLGLPLMGLVAKRRKSSAAVITA